MAGRRFLEVSVKLPDQAEIETNKIAVSFSVHHLDMKCSLKVISALLSTAGSVSGENE